MTAAGLPSAPAAGGVLARPPAAPAAGPAPGAQAHSGMDLARRLALLTAVLSLVLVLGATEMALRWSANWRLDERRRESEALADTWAAYLARVSPGGTNLDAIAQALARWPSEHITSTDAAVFVPAAGAVGALRLASSTDSTSLLAPAAEDAQALERRRVVSWATSGASPAWHVAEPVGGAKPWGVLHVVVSTTTLKEWARVERERAYLLGLVAALLVAGGVAFLTMYWVQRPLRALGEAMTRAHGGVAQSPPAPELGPEEFRRLARRYNELREALLQRQRESEARGALLALEERARNFDRLALLEETAAGFAHEIGTPLNTVSGHLQLLRDDLVRTAPPQALERIQLLLGQVQRLAGIVRARLERGAWPAPVPRRADLGELGQRMLRFLAPALERAGIRAAVVVQGPPPVEAWCDPAMVEQVLLNLLKNAIEALRPGDSITLTAGHDADGAWLEVADSGPGLAPEAQQQLFHPFATTKGREGTGLGLAVSRRLARALGGDVVLVPSERGTTWRLTLPLAAEAGRPVPAHA